MGNILDDAYEDGREDGFDYGSEHKERDMIGGLLRQGLLTPGQTAGAAGIPLERVETIAAGA